MEVTVEVVVDGAEVLTSESREALQEGAGLSLVGEAGEPLRPDEREEPPPPLAKDVVEPSLATERSADDDNAGDD